MISRGLIRKPLILLTFCCAAVCLPPLIAAQNSSDTSNLSTIAESTVVRKFGYTFQSFPLRFQSGPIMNFDFSISRDDTVFSALNPESIEAFQDGDKLPFAPGGLQDMTKTPVAAMILVDVSYSMRNPEFRKLDALETALNGFIEGIDEGGKREERISLAEFDYEARPLINATSSKASLRNAVGEFYGRDNRTRLYDAIKWFLEKPEAKEIQNLIVLSDGVDSTKQRADAKKLTGEELASYKRELLEFEVQNERAIIDKAGTAGIRIFAIEMGLTEEDYKSTGTAIAEKRYESMYVYRDSLRNISRDTGARPDHYINLVKIEGADYDKGLSNSLRGELEEIRNAYKYNYSLPLSLAGRVQQDGKQHTAVIKVGVNSGYFESKVDYVWNPGESVPRAVIKRILFIQSPDHKDVLAITRIYAITIVALVLLSGAPPVMRRLTEGRETRRLRRLIIKIRKGSPYLGKECPSEGSFRRFREGDDVLICPAPDCNLAHHLDCWHQAGGRCYKRNCSVSRNPRPLPEALAKNYKLHPGS